MSAISVQDEHLKELLKQAIVELLEERQAQLYEILAEAIEEVGLVNAIKEGESSYKVEKEDVKKVLGE
jgi:dsDNA-binding SOS-regulon protein